MNKIGIAKKVAKIFLNILLYVFVGVCLFGVILSVASKKDADGTANIFGYQMRFVQSPSMEKCDQTDVSGYDIKDIRVKSVVFIETVPENAEKAYQWYSAIEVGDVLTFKYYYTRQETITHRVVDIDEYEDGFVFYLEGDNKASEEGVLTQIVDTRLTESPNYVVGKVVGQNYALGLFVYALKTPVGLIFIVIVPCLIIIGVEIVRIVSVLGEEKKEKRKKEAEAKENEIEELKRKLALLQQATEAPPESAIDPAPASKPSTEKVEEAEEADKTETEAADPETAEEKIV